MPEASRSPVTAAVMVSLGIAGGGCMATTTPTTTGDAAEAHHAADSGRDSSVTHVDATARIDAGRTGVDAAITPDAHEQDARGVRDAKADAPRDTGNKYVYDGWPPVMAYKAPPPQHD